jgi:hypothetical protein
MGVDQIIDGQEPAALATVAPPEGTALQRIAAWLKPLLLTTFKVCATVVATVAISPRARRP